MLTLQEIFSHLRYVVPFPAFQSSAVVKWAAQGHKAMQWDS